MSPRIKEGAGWNPHFLCLVTSKVLLWMWVSVLEEGKNGRKPDILLSIYILSH